MFSAVSVSVSIGVIATVSGLTGAAFSAAGKNPGYGLLVGAIGGGSLVAAYFRGPVQFKKTLVEGFGAAGVVVGSQILRDAIVNGVATVQQNGATYAAEGLEAFSWASFFAQFKIPSNAIGQNRIIFNKLSNIFQGRAAFAA